jgi:hypothetical protein
MRKILLGIFTGILLISILASPGLGRQGGEAIPSPPAKASCAFPDGKTIHVNYSSPRMRGRKIFGELVPFGEEWRAGANEATTFVVNAPVLVQQKLVPAGSYTIFTLPTPDKWTLIISKQTGEWGIPYPGKEFDFTRIPMNVSKLPAPLEKFTIAFDKAADHCTMRLDWETTRASVDISEKK